MTADLTQTIATALKSAGIELPETTLATLTSTVTDAIAPRPKPGEAGAKEAARRFGSSR